MKHGFRRAILLIASTAILFPATRCMGQGALGIANGPRDTLYARAEDLRGIWDDGWLAEDAPGRIVFRGSPSRATSDTSPRDASADRLAFAEADADRALGEKSVAADEDNSNPAPKNVFLTDSIPNAGNRLSNAPSFPGTDASTRREYPGNKAADRFRWKQATLEALFFTGLQHTFNLASEPGTRDTLNGHFATHYLNSVSELRGWSDSDAFMAPYIGHTIEGSAFGFIERQNDPKYRGVQLGDGRDYWISLLRSMAFSAVWHTQWKIGPIS